MVYAGSVVEDGASGSQGTGPSSPDPHPDVNSASGTEAPISLEALRHAIEAQEDRVRILRARKAARERLLLRIQSLLATGDAIESHHSVERIVRQAEESLAVLQQTEQSAEAEETETDGVPSTEVTTAAAAPASDPLARVFHSGVEAQLAMVPDGVPPPQSSATPASIDTLLGDAAAERRSGGRHKKRKAPLSSAPATRHADPSSPAQVAAAASPIAPHSAATQALLSQSASRAEAARAALMAALESLQMTLQERGARENAEGHQEVLSAAAQEPAWLRAEVEEEKKESACPEAEGGAVAPNTLSRSPSRSFGGADNCSADVESENSAAAPSEDYTDDFESTGSTTEAEEEEEAASATRDVSEAQVEGDEGS